MKLSSHSSFKSILQVVLLSITTIVLAKKPNILVIFSDDHAKQALSCYGNTDIQTPALDRIAEEGMRFEHALTPNSFCTPARAAALTGKYSHRNGVTHLNQRFDGSQQTFPKLLQKAGYETTLFGKWHLLSRPTGFDYFCVQKMQGKPWNPNVFEPHHTWIDWSPKTKKEALQGGRIIKGYNNDVITTEALNWLIREKANDWDFSPEGRTRQAKRMLKFAEIFIENGFYVVADFVCPTSASREIFKPDFIIWVDTIKASRFEDTNDIFTAPEKYDLKVTTQDAEKWSIEACKLIKKL